MEDLAEVGIEDASVDLVVSNCVFNLSPDKPRLFRITGDQSVHYGLFDCGPGSTGGGAAGPTPASAPCC